MRKKKILYLDQFAVSNMVDSTEGSVWYKAKTALLNAVKSNRVICPIPMEHYIETGARHREDAIRQDDFFVEICGGKMFRLWEEIIASEIMLYVKHHITKPLSSTYLTDADPSKDFRDNTFWDNVTKAHLMYSEMIENEKYGLNEVRSIIRDGKNQKHDNDNLFMKAILKNASDNFSVLFSQIAMGKKLPGNTMISQCHKENRIAFLLCLRRFTGKDFYLASLEFRKNYFSNFPTLNSYYQMKANLALNQIKESKNDDIDLERISASLNVSDVMFTDKRQKNRIVELGLDKQYNTTIYSGQESDLWNFIEQVEKL